METNHRELSTFSCSGDPLQCELAAKKALQASGKFIPWQVVTISLDGRIIDS